MLERVRTTDLIDDPSGTFAREFERRSFAFEHHLRDHPLFSTENLVALSRRLPGGAAYSYWSNGAIDVGDGWEKNRSARYSLADTIANIAENDSLVILKQFTEDPEYGPLVRGLLERIIELSGLPMRSDVAERGSVMLISSPRRITPYHFDSECNYLVQLVGRKTLFVYDREATGLPTQRELERYHAGEASAASYDEERRALAIPYELDGGQGVHVPVHSPHSALVADNVSVALSINYHLHSVRRKADVLWTNHQLRRAGITPAPPGTSPLADGAKIAAARCLRGVQTLLRGRDSLT